MSSKKSLAVARLKQRVGLGHHTVDNEVAEAVARSDTTRAAVKGLAVQLAKLSKAQAELANIRLETIQALVAASGISLDDPTRQDAQLFNTVVQAYNHLDGDLMDAMRHVYKEIVLGQVEAWEEGLGAINELVEAHSGARLKYDHYTEKVRGLQEARRTRLAKGKADTQKDLEKLQRNDDKLEEAKEQYQSSRTALLGAIATSWDDRAFNCQKVLLRLTQYEAKLHKEATTTMGNLAPVTSTLLEIILSRDAAQVRSARPVPSSSSASPAASPPAPPGRARSGTAGSSGAVIVDDSEGKGDGNPFSDSDEEEPSANGKPSASPPFIPSATTPPSAAPARPKHSPDEASLTQPAKRRTSIMQRFRGKLSRSKESSSPQQSPVTPVATKAPDSPVIGTLPELAAGAQPPAAAPLPPAASPFTSAPAALPPTQKRGRRGKRGAAGSRQPPPASSPSTSSWATFTAPSQAASAPSTSPAPSTSEWASFGDSTAAFAPFAAPTSTPAPALTARASIGPSGTFAAAAAAQPSQDPFAAAASQDDPFAAGPPPLPRATVGTFAAMAPPAGGSTSPDPFAALASPGGDIFAASSAPAPAPAAFNPFD